MWEPDGERIPADSWGKLTPDEILFEFEEPLTFICRDPYGLPLLAHNLSAEDGLSRYLIVVSDSPLIEDLKSGHIDLLSALNQPRCLIADFGREWKIHDLWMIPFEKIPKRVLPKAGAMLSPDIVPVLRV